MQQAKIEVFNDAVIDPITLSDHAPITISFELEDHIRGTWQWRHNESLLTEELAEKLIRQEIKEELEFYFKTNKNVDNLPQTIREAHKTYIQGIFVKIGSTMKKQRNKKKSWI